eukprot:8138347-Alexandrium_andersonii.AAC.1
MMSRELPLKPSVQKPKSVCPFMMRGQACEDPVCLANREHTDDALHRAQAWKDYEDQCKEFQHAMG